MKKKMLALIFSLAGLVAADGARADVLVEGFESGNLSQYTTTGGNGPPKGVVGAAYAHDGSFGLGLGDPNDANWYIRTDSGATLHQGESFFAWVRLANVTASGGRAYFGFGSSTGNTYAVVLAPNTGGLTIQEDQPSSAGFTNLATVNQAYVANSWYKVGVTWAVGGLINVNLYGSDGTTLLNTVSVTNNDITTGGIAFRAFIPAGGNDSFDTVTLLTPVPEPSSLALVAGGLVGLAGLRLRARRKA